MQTRSLRSLLFRSGLIPQILTPSGLNLIVAMLFLSEPRSHREVGDADGWTRLARGRKLRVYIIIYIYMYMYMYMCICVYMNICIYVYMYMICLCICICICIYYVFIMYLDISFTFCLFSPIHWWSLVLVQWKFRQVVSPGRRVSTTTPQMSVEPKKIIIAQDKSAQSPIDSQCSIYDFHSAF